MKLQFKIQTLLTRKIIRMKLKLIMRRKKSMPISLLQRVQIQYLNLNQHFLKISKKRKREMAEIKVALDTFKNKLT